MTDKLLLHKVNVEKQTVEIDGTEHAIKEEAFPTVNFDSGDIEDVYQLSEEEEQVMEGLRMAFVNSIRLRPVSYTHLIDSLNSPEAFSE